LAQDELNSLDDEIARLMAQFTTKPPAGAEPGAPDEGEVVD